MATCNCMGGPNCCRNRFLNDIYKPLVLEGEAARQFLADMEERERVGNTPEQQAFLDECRDIYLKSQAKLAQEPLLTPCARA